MRLCRGQAPSQSGIPVPMATRHPGSFLRAVRDMLCDRSRAVRAMRPLAFEVSHRRPCQADVAMTGPSLFMHRKDSADQRPKKFQASLFRDFRQAHIKWPLDFSVRHACIICKGINSKVVRDRDRIASHRAKNSSRVHNFAFANNKSLMLHENPLA